MTTGLDEAHRVIKNTAQRESGTMLSMPFLNQGEVLEDGDPIKDMSVMEMEKALYRNSRRPAEHYKGNGAPQSARALFEENKELVLQKQQRKALARKNSRDFVDKILASDRVTIEADKARNIGRRTAQRGLAQYYKAKIAEKEDLKAGSYQSKLDHGPGIQYFPFVEGETISQNRQVEAGKMRDEMRSFLQRQREQHPPRVDSLMADSDPEYYHRYPLMPVQPLSARSSSSRKPPSGAKEFDTSLLRSAQPSSGEGAGSYSARGTDNLDRYPRFLTRAREHMSRRIHDAHVRKALEDKVERTKQELEEMTRKKSDQAQSLDEGMMVNDALRYDTGVVNAAERKKNAAFLQTQAEDKRIKKLQEVQERRAECAGYWGPDEKDFPDSDLQRHHCGDLIRQMQVNQHRRLDSRSRRLDQERVMIDNSVAEMSADRAKEREKLAQHRQILITTWDSQRKIRQVMDRIDAL
jgi:hypothetical protein